MSIEELSIGRNSANDTQDLTAIKHRETLQASSLDDINGMQIGSVMLGADQRIGSSANVSRVNSQSQIAMAAAFGLNK